MTPVKRMAGKGENIFPSACSRGGIRIRSCRCEYMDLFQISDSFLDQRLVKSSIHSVLGFLNVPFAKDGCKDSKVLFHVS